MRPEEYRKLAELEDRMWYFAALHRRRADWLARLLPPGPARVLDAGCGTGGFLRSPEVTGRGWSLLGLDLAPEALAVARARTAAEIHAGDLARLPWAERSLDAVTTGDVLYHVDDVAAVLREFARCLRPGGALVLNEPAYRWLWSYHDVATEARRRFERAELAALVRAAGFEILFTSHANAAVLPLVVARRKLLPPAGATSDVAPAPAVVESVLGAVAAVENAVLCAGVAWPAGSSVFVVARRRG